MSNFPFSQTQITSAVRAMKVAEENMTSSGIIPEAEANKIVNEWFAPASGSGDTKKEAGLLGVVTGKHQPTAWLRVLLFFCTHSTSDKQVVKKRKDFEVYLDDTTKHKVNGLDLQADIRSRGYTTREFFRRFAAQAIEMLKHHEQWAPRLIVKWGVPQEKWYLCCDFADRLTLAEIKRLKLTNDDLVIINNLTFSNTARAAEKDSTITSNATIFNPGQRGKATTSVGRMITQ